MGAGSGHPRRWPLVLLLVAAACTVTCTGDWYSRDADREVSGVLDEYNDAELTDRATRIQLPELVPPAPEIPADVEPTEEGIAVVKGEEAAPTVPVEPVPPPLPIVLDLSTSLATALRESRNFKDAKDALYLQGLGFTFTRFSYGPQWTAAVNYLWGDADGVDDASSLGGSLGVSQLLPTNGTLALSGGLVKSWADDDLGLADDWGTTAGISLTQPLLRGAGYGLYRETLTQAEHNMIYAVRSFELFREDFTISITAQFFNLVGQKRKLVNNELDLVATIFDEEKQIALRSVDRADDKGVINARRARLNSESALTDAQTAYKRSIERFLIQLGLDPNTQVELVEEEPPYEIVTFDPASAVDVAMHNRLDVQTQRDQNEDAERQFQLARNNLLPDLNLSANYGSGGTGRNVGNALPDTWARSASASLEIPLQTIDRRNAWRSAEISIAQTRRNWDLFVDDVKSSIEDQIRQLANTERQIEISEQSIVDEIRASEYLEFQVDNGDVDQRELTDSRQQLINSRNGLVDQKVQHLIQQLTLYKDLGILFIAEDGSWSVGAPQAPDPRRP